MKAALLLIFLLFGAATGFAQVDCAQTVTGSDAGCTYPHDCLSTNGCTKVTFQAACTGNYDFDVWTKCDNVRCYQCQACAVIFPVNSAQRVGDCHTDRCNQADCNKTCSVPLVAGVEYDLYVCLIPCPGIADDCTDCGNDCAALACVRYGSVATCY